MGREESVSRLRAFPGESGRRRVARFGGTAVVAFAFYLLLGDPTDSFDVATGLVSAAVVAAVLGQIAFERAPSTRTLLSVLRATVFVPVLLFAVARANLSLAAVVHRSIALFRRPFVQEVYPHLGPARSLFVEHERATAVHLYISDVDGVIVKIKAGNELPVPTFVDDCLAALYPDGEGP
jgi:hypothetical protein